MAATVMNGFSIVRIITVFNVFFNNFLFRGKQAANFLGDMGFQSVVPDKFGNSVFTVKTDFHGKNLH